MNATAARRNVKTAAVLIFAPSMIAGMIPASFGAGILPSARRMATVAEATAHHHESTLSAVEYKALQVIADEMAAEAAARDSYEAGYIHA